jgi:hypothetical protein
MICFAKSVLTEDLYIVHKDDKFIRDKPILSSGRMSHKDYDHKVLIKKKYLVVSLKELNAKTK